MKTAMFNLMMAIGFLVCFSSAGYGSNVKLASSDVAVITALDESESRLLVNFDLPELPEGHGVYYADITFHVPGLGHMQELELFEAGTAWTGTTAKWEEPWTSPGGDLRNDRIGCWISDNRTGEMVKFVVTESVSRLASGAQANYGFIILFSHEDRQKLQSPEESPVLTIYSGLPRRLER